MTRADQVADGGALALSLTMSVACGIAWLLVHGWRAVTRRQLLPVDSGGRW